MKKIILFVLVSYSILSGLAQITPCEFQYGKTEKDSLKCWEEFSLFKNHYDQKNYAEAYLHWKNIVNLCPCSRNAIFNTTSLQNMFDYLIKTTDEKEIQNQYIDELLNTVATRHLYFPKHYTKGNGLGFKAFYMIRYRGENTEDVMKAFDLFIESIEMEKENTLPNILGIYFRIAEQIARTQRDTTIIIDAYERTTHYIETAINNYYKELDKQISNFDNLKEIYERRQIQRDDYENRKQKLSQDTVSITQLINNYKITLKDIESIFAQFVP